MKKFILGSLALACVLSSVACGTTKTTTSRSGLVTGSFEQIRVPAKDFEPLQLVFAETIVGNTEGAGMTYDALLREAYKIGGHSIVNVVIEDVRVCETTNSSFKTECTTTRYGSALAIRYTKALTYDQVISGSNSEIERGRITAVTQKGFFDSLFGNNNTATTTVNQ